MYDAIVVGARCAGSPTAMLLGRKGYRVLLVDKATFPSDIISGHYIHQPGVASLKRWGLLERVAATNCPPIRKVNADWGPVALSGSPPPADGVAEAYCPRRKVLDKILLDAAAESGAEVRENLSVRELTFDDDGRVTGIRGRQKDTGNTITEPARIVIGADGPHSLVARSVKAAVYNDMPTLSYAYASYWSGVPLDGIGFFWRNGQLIGSVPTNDKLTLIFTQGNISGLAAFRVDYERNFYKVLDLVPSFAERVRAGKREERFFAMSDMPNFFRQPYGPGWALVGDAGYHQDPITAEGMTDAFRDAEILVDAIDDGFAGRRPLEQALAAYEQKRNQAAMPLYAFTCQAARCDPVPPERISLFSALKGNQADTNRLFGIGAGTTPISEFMAPENIQRIMAAAA